MVSKIPKYQRFRDPFAEDPVPKAFYHPTQQRDLSPSQKRTALSPVRGPNKGDSDRAKLTVPDKQFLKGANTLSSETPPRLGQDVSPKFDESWPSSEHQSTVSLLGVDNQSPETTDLSGKYSSYIDRFSDLKQTLQFSENDSTLVSRKHKAMDTQHTTKESDPSAPTSVLSRYIERFRQGHPMSREERKKSSKPGDFWWLDQEGKGKSPSDSSTPREVYDTHRAKTQRLTEESLASLSQSRKNKYVDPSKSRHVPPSPSEERIRKLQEKADRFLEKSVSSLATTDQDFEVSTEGLGSSVGETTQISLEELPYRPKFVKDLSKENVAPRLNLGVPISMVTKPTCPEQDILYQWRLKRKMEQARERTANVKDTSAPSTFVPKSQTMGDVEKKLEEFKQRLSEGKLGVPVTPQMTNGIVSFTPAPSLPHHSDGKEDTSAPRNFQGRPDVGLTKGDSSNSGTYPPIASPTLKRKVKKGEDVEPHLHLMCDLLPCPHQSEFSKRYGEVPVNVASAENVKESESETYKYLEAERPDIEESISDHKYDQSDDSGHMGTSSEVRGQSREVKRRIKYDGDINTENEIADQGPKRKDKAPDEATSFSQRDDDSLSDHNNVPYQQKKHTFREASVRNKEDLLSKEEHQEMKERKEEKKKGREVRERSRQKGRKEKEDVKSVPVLRQSQSPRPQAGRKKVPHVESTIGQVIKDRLFDLSTSSVISSVDSMPTFMSPSTSLDQTMLEAQPPQGRLPQTQVSTPETTESQPHPRVSQNEDEESDGEFPDDQLLTMLRRQRTQYEEQLRVIDEKLNTIARNGNGDSGR
ncbi:uncharacterized protein LOC132547926 [Ylistrum balloti]|uniref:uncharacterized protein LOC132547926 n=1 Tax=Ylistrum balloti TaxID=509963 RepID=UPI002905D909|nr:uncharacterized protein LOC132547926 [Ylistrum balloti]